VSKTLRVGATVQNVVSKIASRVTLSGCPAQTICAPEDPEFDADTKLTQLALFAPAASAGVQWDVLPLVTLGAMAQTPTRISNQCRSRARDRAPVLRAREARSTSGTRGALARGRPRRGSHVHDRAHARDGVRCDALRAIRNGAPEWADSGRWFRDTSFRSPPSSQSSIQSISPEVSNRPSTRV